MQMVEVEAEDTLIDEMELEPELEPELEEDTVAEVLVAEAEVPEEEVKVNDVEVMTSRSTKCKVSAGRCSRTLRDIPNQTFADQNKNLGVHQHEWRGAAQLVLSTL